MACHGIHGMVWYGIVWYVRIVYGMVWHGMAWYGMAWYTWYGMHSMVSFIPTPTVKTLIAKLSDLQSSRVPLSLGQTING